MVDAFEEEERQKEAEMVEIKRLAEEEGIYEVHRILEVKFNKVIIWNQIITYHLSLENIEFDFN